MAQGGVNDEDSNKMRDAATSLHAHRRYAATSHSKNLNLHHMRMVSMQLLIVALVLMMLTNDVTSFVIPRTSTIATTTSRSSVIDLRQRMEVPTFNPFVSLQTLDMVASSSHPAHDSIPSQPQAKSKRARLKEKLSQFRKRKNSKETTTSITTEGEALVTMDGDDVGEEGDSMLIKPGHDGVYHISNAEQHKALLEQHKDKLIIIKYYASYCMQCQKLMPHYKMLMNSRRNKKKPIIYADLDVNPTNKEFIQSMDIIGIPTFQFYVGNVLIDQFLCGPKNVRKLKDKVNKFINTYVNSKTNTIITLSRQNDDEDEEQDHEDQTVSSLEEEHKLANA